MLPGAASLRSFDCTLPGPFFNFLASGSLRITSRISWWPLVVPWDDMSPINDVPWCHGFQRCLILSPDCFCFSLVLSRVSYPVFSFVLCRASHHCGPSGILASFWADEFCLMAPCRCFHRFYKFWRSRRACDPYSSFSFHVIIEGCQCPYFLPFRRHLTHWRAYYKWTKK